VLRDITERKRAEAELAAANKELERANAELETLVYSASHDLKSPMVSLLGYLEYLRLDFGEVLGPEGNRYLNRMADSTVYMQQLIHDLIDLSRVGRSGVEPIKVDLHRLVQAIAGDAGAANPAAEIRVGRLPMVTGDPVGFRQLFTNLLDNAIRHGGRPDLVVVVDGRDRPDGAVELSVRDNGTGIRPSTRARVRGLRAPGGPVDQRGHRHGPGHLPQDRRGPGRRHRHRRRPRHRRPHPAPQGRRGPLAGP
jgi:two-component system sensor kinase FixL